MNMQQRDSQEQQTDNFEVYIFTSGITVYRYTSYEEDVVIGGNTYIAVPIKRSSFNVDIVDGTIRCNIQAPITHLFAQYIVGTPFVPVDVEIRRYYADDLSQSMIFFIGRIKAITISKQVASAECSSDMDELNRKIPRVFVQSFCNNSLYGAVCGINRAGWVVNTFGTLVVDPVDSSILRSPVFDTYRDGYFSLGIAEYNNEERYITSHNGDTIILHFPYLNLSSGDTVYVYPGCNKNPSTCRDKFNNLTNFVGMPYVPTSPNPTQWGVD